MPVLHSIIDVFPRLYAPATGTKRFAAAACIGAFMLALAVASPASAQMTDTAERWVPGRLLVQPRPGLSDEEFAKILKVHGAKSVGRIPGINVHIVQLPPNASEKAVAAQLAHNPHIKFAERDMLLKPELTANDTYYFSEWHLTTIGAPSAWDISNGNSITIAIVDTGVEASHPDLAGKLVAGWNYADNNSDTSDVFGHGTKVAGTAAAITNNGIGVAGVAGGAKIMPIRVTNTSGLGSLSYMASGIVWAADRGARVANLSFEAVGGYSTTQSAAQYMKNKGGLVTTAAGNGGTQQTFAYSDTNIVVAATDGVDNRASWSNYGDFISLAAPGVSIYTTAPGAGYGAVSGTSFSAPITAGVVALMMAANPTLPAAKIQSLLYSTALDLGSAGKDIYFGYGRVNAGAAVLAARNTSISDTVAPTVSLTAPASGATVAGLVSVNVSASDNVGVSGVDLLVNGTKLASDSASPYGFTWDSSKVPDGNVTLTADAYDAAGNRASSSITVKVANTADAVPPVVVISQPGDGAKVSGNVNIVATASDNVAVARMTLYIDGESRVTASGASLSYNWKTRRDSMGTHTIRVDATDPSGNTGSRIIQVVK